MDCRTPGPTAAVTNERPSRLRAQRTRCPMCLGPRRRPATRGPAATAKPAPRPAAPEAGDTEAGPLGTAVQAAAELAEIGLMASARALRSALSRLPRR